MTQTENKTEVLEAAVKFLADFISLWNTKVVELGEPDQKISKEDLINELNKTDYEI